MIVLTTKEKDWLINFLEEFTPEMQANGLQIVPVEFKAGWMLPEAVLNDPRCKKAKDKLIEIGEWDNMTIREVADDELIVKRFNLGA